MRYDLAFFLCCCKSFLGNTDGEDFYSLLGVERDATHEEVKRAYKRQSLQMHPDKLAQRGRTVTEADQARFTRMKEAYEVLSDPHKRETYDAIGERGMKWMEEPFSLDPQELAHNFATSSTLDRSKIFAIFVFFAVAIFLLPVMICLQADRAFGNSTWMAVLTPLWIWNAIILFYHSRVIMMGPIVRPDHIPEEEWVDPLPMHKRMFSLVRFLFLLLFELLATLKIDAVIKWRWAIVFAPIYIWEATTFYKKWPLARMKIVTVQDLETALGKPFAEFTAAEKELIANRYSVVPSTNCPEYEAAQKLKMMARQDLIKLLFRVALLVFLIAQLDGELDLNWWIVFAPFWIMTFCICYANYQSFQEVQSMVAEKDPTLFGLQPKGDEENGYGAMGAEGDKPKPEISPEEREELKAQVMSSGSKMMTKCCSQAFILIIVCLFVGKIQGAPYSAMWIISPLLLIAGIALCCLGCTIFCITEIPNEVDFDTGQIPPGGPVGGPYMPPGFGSRPNAARESTAPTPVPTSRWDPEKGQVWEEPVGNDANSAQLPERTATPDIRQQHILSKPLDLLDNNQTTRAESRVPDDSNSTQSPHTSSIHELD